MSTSERIVDTDPSRVRFDPPDERTMEAYRRRQLEFHSARLRKFRADIVAMERLVYMGLAIASFVMLTVIAFK